MFARRWATPTTRKTLAAATVAGLALTLGALAAPAQAAEQNVSDVTLSWGLNLESGAGAFQPGACNFISAGKAGNSGASRAWTEGDGFYKQAEGNVAIVKDGPDGSTINTSWANKCQTGAGGPVAAVGLDKVSNNKVVLSKGTGTVDTAAKTANIKWTGSFTSVFYSGLTYWSATNPELTVKADGTATLTATASGYGASMDDPDAWEALAPQKITLANLKGVEVDSDGFIQAPEYKEVTTPSSVTNQITTGANWGAFPQDFIEFQGKTGAQPYWYSSGGGADPRKVATDLAVNWDAKPPVVAPPADTDTEKSVDVAVKVPTKTVTPGAFSWTLGGSSISLGNAEQNAAGFSASGALPEITVTDSRENSTGWSLTGKSSAFESGSNSFTASALGWVPGGSGTTGVVNAGDTVTPGTGLAEARNLVTSTGKSTATVEAVLNLIAPAGTPAGNYTSRLTITAISD
ncbi:hypothetical protein CQ018_12955 [Arthrobacter sp. MYb227]|uniref:hypothetical protein n=1 Tax=Arthrobacter sp. MYb227 TaxID=1848601 RepID=UPI000CFC86F1|nr:hypothetical protein [Arthrobacter sp. MYb227]PQZ91551.1 hypothetical protein CQ018_12955 [Arthrobacter sp. MYb227]